MYALFLTKFCIQTLCSSCYISVFVFIVIHMSLYTHALVCLLPWPRFHIEYVAVCSDLALLIYACLNVSQWLNYHIVVSLDFICYVIVLLCCYPWLCKFVDFPFDHICVHIYISGLPLCMPVSCVCCDVHC